jgi:hypothetical protein
MGGNVFKDVEPFDHNKVELIKSAIFPVLDKLRVAAFPIGSTARPTPGHISGDYDVLVDERPLASSLKETNPKKLRKLLSDKFVEAGFETALNAISVHVRVPDGDHAYQVDVSVVAYARQISEFHIHTIPEGSPYKGTNKHIALCYLARKQNLLWSCFQGLYSRDENGKRGDLITLYSEQVSYVLLGANSTSASLGSLESILAALPKDEADAMMEVIVDDPKWKEHYETA